MRAALTVASLLLVGGALGAQQLPDRSAPPLPGPPAELQPPAIERSELSGGLEVWLVEVHEIPLVQVNLLLRTGSSDDPPPDKYGVSDLMATMLDEGAGDRSALELADAVEFLGATLRTGNSFDGMSVRLNVPVSQIREGLELMADVALRPTFPELDLERVREERLTDLRQRRDDPAAIIGPAFDRVIFGPEHRYGTGLVGTPSTLSTITRDDLVDFHMAAMQPANAVVVVVGDTTMTEIRPLLEGHFGRWTNTSPVRRRALPTPPQRMAREVFLVDVPGAAQSQIRIGGPGVSRSTPDYFPLQVVNTVLGGSFASRLNQNLREEHGYTYGAGSGFQMRRSPGAFLAVAGVETDATADALREFFLELVDIRQPIPEDELARAKNYLALGFPGDFETIQDFSGKLDELAIYGLPDGYLEAYIPMVRAVNSGEAQRVAMRYIDPDRFAVVVVGDLSRIEDDVRALNLGPVQVLTLDEALGN